VDPVSHVVLGASLGYAAFSRRLGRTAAAVGGLAAFVPDADVFISSATDPLVAIEYHRGFTHSFAFAPVGAAIVAALWLASPVWRSGARWWLLWACGLLAYVSHILLDAATSYGTRLLWPFSDHRTGWDLISIIDPPFTLVLLAGLTWALVRQRVSPAGIALTVAAAYLAAGGVQHARATKAQEALARSRGHTVERGEVMPTLGNNVIWRALYAHEGRIYSDRIRVGWFSAATVREGWSLPLVRESDLTPEEISRNERRSFQRFAWFSEHWVARSPRDAAVLADMRYTLSAEAFDPIWGIRFTAPGTPNEVDWVNRSRDRQVSAKDLWAEISGADSRFRPLSSLAQ
jgi:inner membrane protein